MNIKLDLFLTFFKLGATTFGGGHAMVSMLKESVIDKKKWISNDELLEICAIAESTPGPVAINTATFIGYKKAGVLGSILSTLGVVLPSFIIIYLISLFFDAFISNQYVAYAFSGIKCAVGLLIINAGIKLAKGTKKAICQYILIFTIIALMLVFEIFAINFSSIILIICGGIIGIIASSISGKKEDK